MVCVLVYFPPFSSSHSSSSVHGVQSSTGVVQVVHVVVDGSVVVQDVVV